MLSKVLNRLQRKQRVRAKISGTSTRPRLNVFRSNANIYAQLIDDTTGKTLVSANDLKLTSGTKTQRATKVGEEIATKAKEAKISDVVFDRGGFVYHGRVKALAEWARSSWLHF